MFTRNNSQVRFLYVVIASMLWMVASSYGGWLSRVKDIHPGPGSPFDDNPRISEMNGVLYFSANDGIHGEELWVSNGTECGTYMVGEINPGAGTRIGYDFKGLNDVLYFWADDGVKGRELWSYKLGTIQGNVAEAFGGGGIYLSGDNFHIGNCILHNNTALTSDGGGIYCWKSDPNIFDCSFTDNSANQYGGGIYISQQSSPTLFDCDFVENYVTAVNSAF